MAEPIYKIKLAPGAWQLLWWLIARMDDNCLVYGAWRTRAYREIGHDRFWIMRCVKQLASAGLIDTKNNQRLVRVLVGNIIA